MVKNTTEQSANQSYVDFIFNSIRKKKFMWIVFSIIIFIVIALAITIPTVLITKKKRSTDTTTIISATTITITEGTVVWFFPLDILNKKRIFHYRIFPEY